MRIWVGEVELSGLSPVRVPAEFSRAHLLVRVQGTPLGWLELASGEGGEPFSVDQLRRAVAEQLSFELARCAFRQTVLGPAPTPSKASPFTVIVCTRERPDLLKDCLERLAELDYPSYEVLVIDNAPQTDRTRGLTEGYPVRYVLERRPGLDWARNRGVAEAAHDLVAFVDDDARVDRFWLRALDRAFQEPTVMGVTGLVVPAQLETKAQRYFERTYGGMGKGFHPRQFDRKLISNRQLLWASGFGVGANMAFRRSIFEKIGGFDVALDVGTATRGGGDVELFHRLVAKGHLLRYEPEAIVWHQHRRDDEALQRQIFNNGCSTVPYLTTCWKNQTVPGLDILSYALRDVLGHWLLGRLLRPRQHARSLTVRELAGFCCGMVAYPVARRQAARLRSQLLDLDSVPAKPKTTPVSEIPEVQHHD